ncbi:hypothetical protein [Nostoc sp. UHCC 0870]
MAIRNNLITNFRQKFSQDSVSWGSLALWISSLVVLFLILTRFFLPAS